LDLLESSVASAATDFAIGLYGSDDPFGGLTIGSVDGSFSVVDWSGYPEGGAKPEGPFRMLEGQELKDAQAASKRTLDAIHRADPSLADLHHVHPIQFGGSPNGETIPLSRAAHAKFTRFGLGLQGL